ncbi:PfkB family carbohydrate kinase [Sediminivirga luteola]|uniref:Carbohydrate kinase n=1 Tax=Sediminivirga luteola TaxID=1774748 RepID=A0A8J2TVM3_9MICO|nr:PfkB family carbohydrate kinase [Sediminivirga luteola]MCI2265949.1 PfkB family carbohydrate kinase [Sediminivirga luteola]GGA03615.1 carbohydrate kinase [Sediminivirga luteola]
MSAGPREHGGRLLYTGNVIADVVLTVDALPEPGGDVLAGSSQLLAGGGFNILAAARRDGAEVLYCGHYGTGVFGTIVAEALQHEGIPCAHPPRTDADSGYCIVLVDRNAERTFVTHSGAEAYLDESDLTALTVGDGDVIGVSGYSLAHPRNAAAVSAWLSSVPEAARVILDPSPLVAQLPVAVLDAVLARTDLLSANAREIGILAGDRRETVERAAQGVLPRLRAGGAVLARDGSRGCWIVRPGTAPVHVPGFPVRAVDTTGAGDAHTGVLAAGLLGGLSLPSAVRRANAAAALAVTRLGPATSPTAEEIDALLRENTPS